MSTLYFDHPLQPGDRVPNVVFDAIFPSREIAS
ncbi:AhpC/TSA family protein, partial [Rhizobium leguminosarum]